MAEERKVDGTPESTLATDRADVNLHMGRFVLWFEGGLGWLPGFKSGDPTGLTLAMEGDMNRNTGLPWTVGELYEAANRINRRIPTRTLKTEEID